MIDEPSDNFGSHITDGVIGMIGDREIGPGHVVLSEERYQWLLKKAMNGITDDGYREIDNLRILVSQLRSFFPQATPHQRNMIGEYLLRSLWLGQGEPDDIVFKDLSKPKTTLTLVKE